jgi:hypothetical protein
VLARFQSDADEERVEHVETMRLQLHAIRRMISRLRPARHGNLPMTEDPTVRNETDPLVEEIRKHRARETAGCARVTCPSAAVWRRSACWAGSSWCRRLRAVLRTLARCAIRDGHLLERADDAARAVHRRLDRMEMDERTMIDLHAIPLLVLLPVSLAGGLALGLAYFRALRARPTCLSGGQRPASPWR